MPYAKGPQSRWLAALPKNLDGLSRETIRTLEEMGMPMRRPDDLMYGTEANLPDWWAQSCGAVR